MSWSERYVQDHRWRTDCAIHRACAQLASDPSAFDKFHEMLHCARKRAPRLFEAPVFDGRHLGIDALVNLSRFCGAHIRPASGWAGASSSGGLRFRRWRTTLFATTRFRCFLVLRGMRLTRLRRRNVAGLLHIPAGPAFDRLTCRL